MPIQLNLEKPISFFPQLARALGGIEEAIFVQQLYYWSDKAKNKEDGVYKTQKEWEFETTLTPKMQNRLKKKLISQKILIVKLKSVNNKPILHYKLDNALLQKVIMQYDQREECNMTKGKKHHTENTTESTTDTLATVDTVAGEFDYKSYIEKMLSDKQRHITLIGKYLKTIHAQFPTYKAIQAEIKRNLRTATVLAEYDDSRINKTVAYVREKFPNDWKMETILKYIIKIK